MIGIILILIFYVIPFILYLYYDIKNKLDNTYEDITIYSLLESILKAAIPVWNLLLGYGAFVTHVIDLLSNIGDIVVYENKKNRE